MAALLVMSVLATAFAVSLPDIGLDSATGVKANAKGLRPISVNGAGQVNVVAESVSSADVASSIGFDAVEIEEDIEARADIPRGWKSYPAEVTFGSGWAIMTDTNAETAQRSGAFVKLVFVEKQWVDPNTDAQTTTLVHGRLKIGNENYKITGRTSATADVNADTAVPDMTFDVKKSDRVVGTFTLNVKESFAGNFKVQEGTLTLNSGESYDVRVATDTKAVRKSEGRNRGSFKIVTDSDVENGEEKEVPSVASRSRGDFWIKVRTFFKADRSGSNSDSG